MKKKFHFEYEETEELYINMYRVYFKNRNTYMYKLIVFFVGALVLAIRLTADFSLIFSLFMVKFLVVWGAVFGAAYLINRYLVSGLNVKKGEKRGQATVQTEKRIALASLFDLETGCNK